MLVQMCPVTSLKTVPNIDNKENYLNTLLKTVLENNRLTNKCQTVIPLGVPGSGKTWSCLVMLRRLLSMCGYGEQTDMFKNLEAAGNVIKPLVTAALSGSKESSRMVRIGREYFIILIINCFRPCLLSVR